MEKQTWVSKIKAALKGGDDLKLSRMNSRIDKFLAKQVASRQEKISDLKESLEDKYEEMESYVNTVDFDKLSSDTVEEHSVNYVRGVLRRQEEIEEIEESIKELEEEITRFKKVEKTIYAPFKGVSEEEKK